jgi:hypothetical protein
MTKEQERPTELAQLAWKIDVLAAELGALQKEVKDLQRVTGRAVMTLVAGMRESVHATHHALHLAADLDTPDDLTNALADEEE